MVRKRETKEAHTDPKSGLSRRDFVKAGAAGVGAVALVGAGAAEAGEAEEEEEEVFDVEPVVTLDESKLSKAQLEHPYAKILGPKLVKHDPKQGKLVEVAR